MRIFGADVDIALARPDRETGDRHPLDDREGVALHDHPVGEGAAVALVGVAHDIFNRAGGVGDGLPLDPGRKARATTAAQTRLANLGDSRGGPDRERAAKSGNSAVPLIFLDREGIDDPAARKAEPGLRFEEWQFVDETKHGRVIGSTSQRGDQRRYIG